VAEENSMPLAHTPVRFWGKASACGRCGEWQISARWHWAVPGPDWEVSGRGKASWLFPEIISHLISHLSFPSSFLLPNRFPLRGRGC